MSTPGVITASLAAAWKTSGPNHLMQATTSMPCHIRCEGSISAPEVGCADEVDQLLERVRGEHQVVWVHLDGHPRVVRPGEAVDLGPELRRDVPLVVQDVHVDAALQARSDGGVRPPLVLPPEAIPYPGRRGGPQPRNHGINLKGGAGTWAGSWREHHCTHARRARGEASSDHHHRTAASLSGHCRSRRGVLPVAVGPPRRCSVGVYLRGWIGRVDHHVGLPGKSDHQSSVSGDSGDRSARSHRAAVPASVRSHLLS